MSLIEQRQAAFTARHGTPMGPDHIWLAQRNKEIAALTMIIERLTDEEANLSEESIAVRGAGVGGRTLLPLTPVTDGAHHTTLRRGLTTDDRTPPVPSLPPCRPPASAKPRTPTSAPAPH